MTITINKRAIGCNAKVNVDALLRLSSASDIAELEADCGVTLIGAEAVAHTIDTIFPFSQDLLLFTQGAVLHCANDLICKGMRPRSAAFSLGLGETLDQSEAEMISRSLRTVFANAGVAINNCHSFNSSDTSITVSMLAQNCVLPAITGGIDYCLVLTKPLGAVHVLADADAEFRSAKDVMMHSCISVVDCIRDFAAAPTTDVSGFGFLGHLAIAARRYSLDVEVNFSRVPVLRLQEDSEISCSAVSNLAGFSDFIDQKTFGGAPLYSLFAGETNGPILLFVEVNRFLEFSRRMSLAGMEIYEVGFARFSASGYSVKGISHG